jgi:hypothetical protein
MPGLSYCLSLCEVKNEEDFEGLFTTGFWAEKSIGTEICFREEGVCMRVVVYRNISCSLLFCLTKKVTKKSRQFQGRDFLVQIFPVTNRRVEECFIRRAQGRRVCFVLCDVFWRRCPACGGKALGEFFRSKGVAACLFKPLKGFIDTAACCSTIPFIIR